MAISKLQRRLKIKKRVRKDVFGTAQRPRLSVFRSNKEIYAQLIDDEKGVTIVAAASKDKGFTKKGTKQEVAHQVGQQIGEKAVGIGLKACVFDRNGYLYHGRVKSLAEGARAAGLKF